jgi:glycosyltransferase involved in cell wall biosynthesis
LATSPYYTDRLRRLASQAPGVHFHGRYRHEELAAVLEPIDLLVVPSRWYEGSPYVILEAFAHRKPIIATRLGALPELVRDEVDGLLFARDNVADLARQMQRVVDHPALHQQRVVAQQAITQTERR